MLRIFPEAGLLPGAVATVEAAGSESTAQREVGEGVVVSLCCGWTICEIAAANMDRGKTKESSTNIRIYISQKERSANLKTAIFSEYLQ